jgi:YVTN family beta-propeller protein
MGDGNADGCVNGADYTIWADNFGASALTGLGEGDYDGDGFVLGSDYIIWLHNFAGDCVVPVANVEDIELTPSSAILTELGETITMSARALGVGGGELSTNFTWHSSHPDQLDVDESGRVTARGVGSAEIWAEASGVESLPSMVDMVLLDPSAYVTNTAADLVTVINTLTDEVSATIAVGPSPTRAAVARDGARVYVANTGGNSISVIDAVTNAVVATIPTINSPTAVAVTPNGAEVYVLETGGVLEVIDTALIGTDSASTIASMSFGVPGFNQFGASIAIQLDGSRAYVIVSGALHVIDTATLEVLGSIDVGASPSRVVISPDGTRAFVTSSFGAGSLMFSGQVVVIDTATNVVLNSILLPSLVPDSIAITPDGSRAYVAIVQAFANTNYGMAFVPDNHIAVVDLVSNVLSGWITVQSPPSGGVSITPDRLYLYVAMPEADLISVIDTETDTLVGTTIAVAGLPTGLVISSALGLAD